MESKKRAVLVTGGTGNIGAWVTRLLVNEGFLPVVYDLKPELKYLKDISKKINVVPGDITDFDKLDATIKENKIERVITLAKYLGDRCEQNPRIAVQVNVLGSATVIEAARVNGIRRVVFASSKSVYASVTGKHAYPDLVPITEDWPKFDRQDSNYVPFYSTTNKMVEYFGIRMAMKYNMEFIILRFGLVWGPGKMAAQLKYQDPTQLTEAFIVSKMIDDAIGGNSVYVHEGGNPKESDDYVYNKDVAQGVVKACISDTLKFKHNHREYHIATGIPHTMADFASVLRARFPELSIEVGDGVFQRYAHRPGIRSIFDLSRAREELGYEPEYADLEKAIDDYIVTEKRFGS